MQTTYQELFDEAEFVGCIEDSQIIYFFDKNKNEIGYAGKGEKVAKRLSGRVWSGYFLEKYDFVRIK